MKLKISDETDLSIDLDVLLKTRLLVQANSGGGKSFLLRRLAEQMFGKVQVIIIDPEGEFSTLREKFDYVLVGKGGETPADCRSAGLVAHKLLELHASAVCDLYEMKPQERHHWVRLFLDALIDAPKNLWHPVVIIVDEAHVFCPESKAGESEASGSMIDLATRGRKRGYCAIFATQRLGKLKKDAAAELTNVMIGQTFIDIDRDRAADCLGVSGKERHDFDNQIKTIEQGNFFALGRAICIERTKVKVGSVQTTHPEIGGKKFSAEPPPPSEKVKLMMPKLADLPKAAEDKARTEAELRTEIRNLKAELKSGASSQPSKPATMIETKTIPALTDAERKRLTKLIEAFDYFVKTLDAQTEILNLIRQDMKTPAGVHTEIKFLRDLLAGKLAPPTKFSPPAKPFLQSARPAPERLPAAVRNPIKQNGKLPFGEEKVLSACIQFGDGLKREQITVLTGFKRSTRDAYIYRLTQKEFVVQQGDLVRCTEQGIAALPNFEPLPQGEDLQNYWRQQLPKGERDLFEHIVAAHPNTISREQLTELTGFKRSTRDAYLYRMSNKMLFGESSPGEVRASDNLF